MKFVMPLLALALSLGAPALAETTRSPQPLAIVIHGNGAETERLAQYAPDRPVGVHVTTLDAARVDAVMLEATDPSGSMEQYPLVRAADGSFNGTIALANDGEWSIGIATRVGTIVTKSAPFTLNVVAPPSSSSGLIGVAVGAGVFVLLGGGGFSFLMMRGRRNVPASLTRAA